MSELREYMQSRLAALEPQEQELLARLAPIQSELAELRRALHSVQTKGRPGRRPAGREPNQDSIQGQVLSLLKDWPAGLTATAILERVKEDFGRQIRRESLAPQLSRLCADNRLRNEHGVYRLASAALAQETRS